MTLLCLISVIATVTAPSAWKPTSMHSINSKMTKNTTPKLPSRITTSIEVKAQLKGAKTRAASNDRIQDFEALRKLIANNKKQE